MLKSIRSVIILFGVLGCTTNSSTGTDSLVATDSISVEDGNAVSTQSDTEQDTSQLNNLFNERRDAVLNETSVYYRVSVSTKQYESASDVTWYFDSSFSPRYLGYSWSAEGNDGSTELIIEGGKVVCGQIEELNSTDRWCASTGGTQRKWNAEYGEASVSLLPISYGWELNNQLNDYLKTLKEILNKGERSDDDEYNYLIKSKNVIDVGFEYTETIETRIPKELYDYLIQ